MQLLGNIKYYPYICVTKRIFSSLVCSIGRQANDFVNKNKNEKPLLDGVPIPRYP